MFNPAVIQRLRQALSEGPDLGIFDHHHLRRTKLKFGPSINVVRSFSLPAHAGPMYRPELIVGQPEDATCLNGIADVELQRPAPTIQLVNDACVVGNDAVIDRSGVIYGPTVVETSADFERLLAKNKNNHQGFAIESNGDEHEAVFVSKEKFDLRDRTAFFLHNLEPGNYGSFLFRQLPQMLLALEAGIEFDFYVSPDRTPWLLIAMWELGMPDRPIYTVKEICGQNFKRIYMANQFDAEGFLSPDIVSGIHKMSGEVPLVSEKIYASRVLSGNARPEYRKMVNEPEVEKLARRLGFQIIHPETLSLKSQIKSFASAEKIIGPSGSGMFNVVFSPPGSKVATFESFHVSLRLHAKLYASTGKKYALGFGRFSPTDIRAKHLREWSVSMKDVVQIVEWVSS